MPKVELPYFVGCALKILPEFLSTIGSFDEVHSIGFEPDKAHEGNAGIGMVTFSLDIFSERGVTFSYQYRPGEEGTRGSLSELKHIDFFKAKGDQFRRFLYIEHYCICRNCSGIKPPFCPITTNEAMFSRMSPEERSHEIRNFLK